jgi:hypothetical protein
MHEAGYGILLLLGLLGGLGFGLAAGEASAGTLIGFGLGALAALLLRLRRPGG